MNQPEENATPQLNVAPARPIFGAWFARFWGVSVSRLAGVEKNSGLPLTILCGLTQQNKSFFLGLAFQGSPKEQRVGKIPLKTLLQSKPEAAAECSLIVVETEKPRPELAQAGGWFFIPGWVNGEIRLPLPDSVLNSHQVRSDLRRVRRQQYEYTITHGVIPHRHYYRTMHRPFIRRSHGDAAFFDPLAEFRPLFTKHDLLLLHKHGVNEPPLAGAMILHECGIPRLYTFGVRDGDQTLVRDGAICALYHFCIEHLKAGNFTRVHTGKVRPFLRDGVLKYKRKWGNIITGGFWSGYAKGFALKILSLTPVTKAFLQKNPFIFEVEGELRAAVFTDAQAPLASDEVRKIAYEHFHPGLSKLVIYCFRLVESSSAGNVPPEYSGRIFIRSANELVER